MASRVSTETPLQCMSNFDQVVTQWIAPSYASWGSACISSQDHVVGWSTSPSTVKVHVIVSGRGVDSAVGGGHELPVSYWPGGSRPSRARPRPLKPRVNRLIRVTFSRRGLVACGLCDVHLPRVRVTPLTSQGSTHRVNVWVAAVVHRRRRISLGGS